MGKVKVKVLGDEQAEQEALEEQKKRREEKAEAKKQAKGLNMGGGQRINSVGASEEEIAAQIDEQKEEAAEPQEVAKEEKKEKKQAPKVARARSKRHNENSTYVGNKTSYPLKDAIVVLRKFKKSNFDETVELHINAKEKGISGQISLPHGTGKTLRIKVADDGLIEQIEKGKIDFDVLVAEPSMMPKLARVARVLGPRGLMPNPKAGTITDKPDAVIEKLSKGQINYKTEAAAPIIHLSVGKLSFEDEKLADNINTVLSTIGGNKIVNVTLKSTMSPAILIQM